VDPGLHRDVINALDDFVGDYSAVLMSSLEVATTNLYLKALDSVKGDPQHRAFLDLLRLLNRVLAETTNHLKTGHRSLLYRFVFGELQKLDDPSDLTVITFNYDILIERVLQEIDSHHSGTFLFPGCYRLGALTASNTLGVEGFPDFHSHDPDHEGVQVLKLHGAINWQSTHTSSNPASSAITRPNRELRVVDSTNLPTSLSWKRKNQKRVYMQPIIVPPVSGKRG